MQKLLSAFADVVATEGSVESLPLAAHLHRHCVRCSAGEAARGLRAGADGCFAIHAAGGGAV